MDVIACHKAGYSNAVAPLGTAFTELQARLLKRYTDTVILLFDADTAGQNAALKSVEAFLPVDLRMKVALLRQGEDPDSLVRESGADGLKSKIEEAQDFFLFKLQIEVERNDIRSPQGKAKVTESILSDIVRLKSPVTRAEYCRIIAERLDIPEFAVFQELRRIIGYHLGTHKRNQTILRNASQQIEPDSSKNDLRTQSEIVLLELALHHDHYAKKLLEELPVDFISSSSIGRTLNEVLAHTEQGEWAETVQILLEKDDDTRPKEVNKALFDPEYGCDVDPEKLIKAYNDCLYRGILIGVIDDKINRLRDKMKSCLTQSDKLDLQKEMLELRRQKSHLYLKLQSEK